MVLLDTGTPGTSREIYSKDADDGTQTRNPSVINQALSCPAQWLEHSVYNRGVASSSPITGKYVVYTKNSFVHSIFSTNRI